MTGDRLDRIEEFWRDDRRGIYDGMDIVADVLALVEVARAARDLDESITAITDEGFNLVGHEHVLALGAALARLEGAAE